MTTIAAASSKGGSGKSTLTLILASAFSEEGYTVRIVDADRAGRLAKWAAAGKIPASITVRQADEKTLKAEIRAGNAEADVTLIDVEGTANISLAIAAAAADAVLIPANMSAPDVDDAAATVQLLRDMERPGYPTIPHGLIWSRVPTAIHSRESAELVKQVQEAEVPIVGAVHDRTAYRSMFSYDMTIHQMPSKLVPGLDKARKECMDLAQAVVDLIKSHQLKETAA